MMIGRGWLEEVDANLCRSEPLWRETGDGHARQIKPAFVRVDIGDVGQPNRIWCLTVELLFQQIWRRLQLMVAVRRDWLSTLAKKRRHLVFLHYSGHTPFRNDLTSRQKILMNTL